MSVFGASKIQDPSKNPLYTVVSSKNIIVVHVIVTIVAVAGVWGLILKKNILPRRGLNFIGLISLIENNVKL